MNFILLLGLIAINFLAISGNLKMLGPGKWLVINIEKCETDATMTLKIDVNRHKINRTHDGFNAKMKLDEIVDNTFSIRVDICKYVDGGCKPYQVMADDSFERFLKKYASDNLKDVLARIGLNPPDFPMPVGNYELKDYVFNYDELPPECPWGDYKAKTILLKDGLERGCVIIHVRCYEVEDER